MLLAIDVGNSNNVIGLFSRGKLLTHWRIRTEWTRTSDEYWVLIKEFILLNDVEVEIIEGVGQGAVWLEKQRMLSFTQGEHTMTLICTSVTEEKDSNKNMAIQLAKRFLAFNME